MEVRTKKHQPPLTITQQIENLKNLGLSIIDESSAADYLNNISYYRLVKGYGLSLKDKNKRFIPDTTFDEIVELYLFNRDFRQLLFTKIEMIEITLRCRISNIFSIKYGVLGYEDPANFSDTVFHNEFLEEVNEAISKNSKNPIVKNFISSYEDSKLPFYALLEILSFGSLSKFYKNMKSEDKKAISKTYNIGYTYLESWIEHLAYVRNICAHYGRIYNYSLHKAPILYKQYSEKGINNHYIFATLICLKHLLYNDSKWLNFIETLDQLITGSPHVAVYRMGFPDDWKDILSVL